MRKIEIIYLLALLFLTFSVFRLNIALGGSISNLRCLAADLKSHPRAPHQWKVDEDIPAKYRLLFKWIVRGTWRLFYRHETARGFYNVYLTWSFILSFFTLLAFYLYLKILGFSAPLSFAGCVLTLASPPFLLAYVFPVHTREDPLGYLLIVLGLIAILREKPAWVFAISVIGGFTRETTLLVALMYFLTAAGERRKKMIVCLPAVAVVLLIWMLSGKSYTYNPLAIRTVRYPLESIVALFLVFGFLWIPALARLIELRREGAPSGAAWQLLVMRGPLALALVIIISLALTRVREIRISFILFPWIIPLALDWFREKLPRAGEVFRSGAYWCFASAVAVLLSLLLYYTPQCFPGLCDALGAFCAAPWLTLAYIHLLLTLSLVLPICLKNRCQNSLTASNSG